jgi:hypothetical protein
MESTAAHKNMGGQLGPPSISSCIDERNAVGPAIHRDSERPLAIRLTRMKRKCHSNRSTGTLARSAAGVSEGSQRWEAAAKALP